MKYWEAIKELTENNLPIRRKSWYQDTFIQMLEIPSYLDDMEEDAPDLMRIPVRCIPSANYMNHWLDGYERDIFESDDWEVLNEENIDGFCRSPYCCIEAWKENTETKLGANRARSVS